MSDTIKCLHLADLHFGVENYGFTNPQTGMNTRLEDFSQSLGQAVDRAIEQNVDLAVFAGDAYKRHSPSPTQQREMVKHFCRLADADIPIVMISGNHDIPVIHGKASSIDIFKSLRPGKIHVVVNQPTLGGNKPPIIETQNGPIAVCCLPYISPSFLRNIPDFHDLGRDEFLDRCEGFINDTAEAMSDSIPGDIPRILLTHLTIHGANVGGYRGTMLMTDDIQITAANLIDAGYDYVAAGHIHRYQNLSPDSHCPVVYCGSLDRVDFGEADEEKGTVIARIRRGSAEVDFTPIEVRPFIEISVKTQQGDDITEAILEEINAENIEDAVVRVKFTADDKEIQKIDMKRIHEALKPAHFKAGFIRIPRESSAQRRTTTLSTEVTLADAMAAYLREREEYRDDGEALLEKAKEIEKAVRENQDK